MREIAVAVVASGSAIALAIALTGRWRIEPLNTADVYSRFYQLDTWTGRVWICSRFAPSAWQDPPRPHRERCDLAKGEGAQETAP